MPLREFKCRCGYGEEVLLWGDQKTKKCPECGGKMQRVIMSLNKFHLKGKGWAKDNYGCKTETKK